MASPATNKRTPDKKMSARSRETCSANAGKERRFNNIAAAIATRVGPIRPAIALEVVIARISRRKHTWEAPARADAPPPASLRQAQWREVGIPGPARSRHPQHRVAGLQEPAPCRP